MKGILGKVVSSMKSNLWFIPGLMGVAAVLVFASVVYLDTKVFPFVGDGWIANRNIQMLSATIGTLVAAIITVFGILLPMKVSIIMRASNQFTPIVLRTYRLALPPKVFIGFIFFTVIYSVLFLLTVSFMKGDHEFFITSAVNFLLVVISLFSIPFLFHYLISSLEPAYLGDQVFHELEALVGKNDLSLLENQVSALPAVQDRSNLSRSKYDRVIQANDEGYLQSIDVKGLISLCQDKDIVFALPFRVGEFVFEGSSIAYEKGEQALSDAAIEKIRECFIFGEKRIGISDLEVLVLELVYMVLKGLSPGVNDISTALECLNSLGRCCNAILNYPFKTGVVEDSNGKVRVYMKEFDYKGFMHCAFDQIRVVLRSQPTLSIYLLNLISQLVRNCQSQDRAVILVSIAEQIKESSKEHSLDYELGKMEELYSDIEKSVAGTASHHR